MGKELWLIRLGKDPTVTVKAGLPNTRQFPLFNHVLMGRAEKRGNSRWKEGYEMLITQLDTALY